MSDFDPFDDPLFPERPDSPAFWQMVECINQLDGWSREENKTLEEVAERLGIDLEATLYMAKQRAVRVHQLIPPEGQGFIEVTAAWLDGFVLGFQYRGRKEDGYGAS